MCIRDSSYSFGKSVGGSYVTILSDGMGSGPDAGRESNTTVSLVEQFLEAGLSKETAVEMINSIAVSYTHLDVYKRQN